MKAAFLAGCAALVGLAALAAYAELKLSRLVLGGLGESFSTKVYSAPLILKDRMWQPQQRLLDRLARLKYRRVEEPRDPGDYSWKPPVLRLALRGFRTPTVEFGAGEAELTLGWGERWALRASSGTVALEPELFAELSGAQKVRREPMTWEEIPESLKDAVTSAEDKRFFRHFGIDPRAVLRAAWYDFSGRGGLYGGSTITQQLAKNYFLDPERTFRRKLAEAFLSFYLELRFGKKQILTLYLNHIYMGQDGYVSVAGMKAATQFYFGKPLSALTLAESATLAAIIRSPFKYNPWKEPEVCLRRRNFVLARMRTDGKIGEPELRAALLEPLRPRVLGSAGERRDRDYFLSEVVRHLLGAYGEDAVYRYGLSVYTTMDPALQSRAQQAVQTSAYQAALVAMDPQNGALLALAGGKEFKESQFNRATQALRQPGSAFKPFVFAAALENGFTVAQTLLDKPVTLQGHEGPWRPRNFDGVYHGTTTLRDALALSMNGATLDLARQVGPEKIVSLAHRLGVTSYLEPTLAIALGSSEVTLLELVSAYAPFDNGGFRVKPHVVSSVVDASGSLLEVEALNREEALAPAVAYLMTSLLQGVVDRGTARSLRQFGLSWAAAGKTGTTNGGADAWFVGYTPDLLAGAWVGDDRSRRVSLTGAKDALPVWARFMRDAVPPNSWATFPQPQGLVSVKIDPASGLLAVTGCPARVTELFVEGTQPTAYCGLHQGGISGFFKRWWGRPKWRL